MKNILKCNYNTLKRIAKGRKNMNDYKEVLKLKVFNVEEVCKITGDVDTAKNTIRSLLEAGYIKRINRNLYAVYDISCKNIIADKYMIASKVKEDSYISYSSAFNYHGIKREISDDIYVSSKKKFDDFEFDGCNYIYVTSRGNFGIMQDGNIRVTDKERTVIDCIDKPSLVGGDKELFLCLSLVR